MLLAFVYVLESFGLGVLFLIAGASVRFALQRRSMGAFLRERSIRLLVPYIIGAIVLIPATSYVIGLHQGSVSGSSLTYLGEYPRLLWINNIAPKGLTPEVLTYAGMHLWFLAWLFICSVLALPVFIFLGSSAGRWLVNRLGRLSHWPAALLLLGVLIAVPRIILSALPMEQTGWSLEAFVWYAIVFVVGYVMYCDDRMIEAVRRDVWLALIVAVLGSYAFISPGFVWQLLPWTYAFVPFWMGVMGITGWAWALAILGMGIRAGFMQCSLPPLASDVALPAYILHFPVVIGISALVVDWSLGFGTKILVNLVLGVGATLLLSALVLRISALRLLLGLRPRVRAPSIDGRASRGDQADPQPIA